MDEYILYLKFSKKGTYKTFEKAFARLYRAIKEQLEAGMGGVIIMATNYITYKYVNVHDGIYYDKSMAWEQARDFAHKMGYLSKEGELITKEKKQSEKIVISEFLRF